MSEISSEDLQKQIAAQLKNADLSSVSAKKVRQSLEKHFDEDLTSRKTEIDEMIMKIVNAGTEQDEEEEEEEGSDGAANGKDAADEDYQSESEEEERTAKSRKKPSKKRAAKSSDDDDEDDDESGDDESYSPQKKKRAAPKARSSRKADDDDDSDDDYKVEKPAKKSKAKGKKGAGTGYTRQCKLSPALAKLMGEERMARHEVIKKMWAMIKEKDMYDPKNKQFAFCNDDMKEVFGVKRFRTFGMMKYLKDHFINE